MSPPPQRYKPSNMTKALGLEAYDFRHGGDDDDSSDSSDGCSGGDSDDSDDSDSDDGSSDDSDEHKNATTTTPISSSRDSSLRGSVETRDSAMDTIMTGDHVGALLRVYEKGDPPPPRGMAGGGVVDYGALSRDDADSDSDGEKADAMERRRLQDNYSSRMLGNNNDHDRDDRDSRGRSPAPPRLSIKQRRRRRSRLRSDDGDSSRKTGGSSSDGGLGSSLETNKEYEADLEELNRDFDEEDSDGDDEDDLEKNIGDIAGGPMGGGGDDDKADNDDDSRTIMFPHNYTSENDCGDNAVKSTARSSCSGHSEPTAAMDNRTLQKLLFMEDDDDDDDAGIDAIPLRYQNIRGSLVNLKDNLAERASQFGEMLKSPGKNDAKNMSTVTASTMNQGASVDNNAGADGGVGYVVQESVPLNFNQKKKKKKLGRKRSESGDSDGATMGIDDGDDATTADDVISSFLDKKLRPLDRDQQQSGQHTDEETGVREQERHEEEEGGLWKNNNLDRVLGGTFMDRHASAANSYRYLHGSDSSPPSPDGGGGGGHSYRPGHRTVRRCAAVLFAMAVTVASSALIGFAVRRGDDGGEEDGHDNGVRAPIGGSSDDVSMEEAIDAIAERGQYTRADLFDMAESVDDHCRSERLSTAMGRWECQQICHDHLCCFDFAEGDGNYNCRNDEGKLCGVFAMCEVLIVNDFVSGSSIVASSEGAIEDEGEGGTATSYDDGSGSATTHGGVGTNANIGQNAIDEDNLGWMEIRKKYVNVYCQDSNLGSKEGRMQCEKVCEHHYCCFDNAVGGNSCQDDKASACDAYEACRVMYDGVDLIDGAESTSHPVDGSSKGDLQTDLILGNIENGADLLDIKANVKERCNSHTPTGRSQCEKMCKFHFCCFDDSVDGCQDNPAKLCNIYDVCKVLISPTMSNQGSKDETNPPHVVLVSPDLEKDVKGDDREPGIDSGDTAAIEQNGKGGINGEGNANNEQISNTVIDQTASAPKTPEPAPEPAPKPTPEPTPEPTLKPTPESTPKPVLSPKEVPAAQTNASKLPKPPPIRCIPNGDDEVHTEVYTDDWNDDRYDRCKRWEKKHDMTVEEYWDVQGIDSTLEKNLLENMLIMDNSDMEEADRSG